MCVVGSGNNVITKTAFNSAPHYVFIHKHLIEHATVFSDKYNMLSFISDYSF